MCNEVNALKGSLDNVSYKNFHANFFELGSQLDINIDNLFRYFYSIQH
jgi:hypothetical protein